MYIFALQFLRRVTEKIFGQVLHSAYSTCAPVQTKPARLSRTDNLHQLGV